MPVATWTPEERRDLFLMQNEFRLGDEQVHDMMGRIYGQRWQVAGRKRYNRADIRDGKLIIAILTGCALLIHE